MRVDLTKSGPGYRLEVGGATWDENGETSVRVRFENKAGRFHSRSPEIPAWALGPLFGFVQEMIREGKLPANALDDELT